MKHILAFVFVMCVIPICAFAQVTVNVSSPADGSSATSSVRVNATATSSHPISAWRIYLDSVAVYQYGAGSAIGTNVALTPGTHQIVVRAWDTSGAYGSVTRNVTSTTASSIAVNIASPTNGATLTSPMRVNASATSSKTITGWNVYLDGASVYTYGTAPSIGTNVVLPAGTHQLVVRAWDSSGAFGSASRTVTGTTGTASNVSVNLISPTNGTTVTSPMRVNASATSSKTITGWNVYLDGVSVYTYGTAPSIGTNVTLSSGSHQLVVRAWDSSGANGSATATVTQGTSSGSSSGPVSVSITPTSSSIAAGGTQQFSASVTGTTNSTITWQVNGVTGGDSTTGTISSSGLYTAPQCPSASTLTVTARSYYDTTAYANATLQVAAATATGNRYVSPTGNDSNDGSACRPWATLQKAFDAATAGMTIHVGPGTYTANGLQIRNSGTSSSHIRFISDRQWGAKIQSSSSYTVLKITGNYVDFMGFEVVGDSGSCVGIANSASNTRIIGNHVHNIPANVSVCGNNGGAAIVSDNYSASNDDIIGNVVHDMGSYPVMDQRVHGIYVSNYGGHVWNNVAYRCAGFGIHLHHAANANTIANNTVFSNLYGGIYIGDGDAPGNVWAGNETVTNNIVVHNGTWGIVETGNIGSGNRYINNVLYANGTNIGLNGQSTQSGTITADPQFVNYTGDSTGDYHLKSTSPAKDAGTNTGAPTIDINGSVRPFNSKWDVGAYEYGANPGAWPWM